MILHNGNLDPNHRGRTWRKRLAVSGSRHERNVPVTCNVRFVV